MPPPIQTFEEAVQAISSLEKRGWRLGLDRMREFADRSGLGAMLAPPDAPGYIHVAGTNGKGSVTSYVQGILRGQGHRTGAFYSPYVYDVRERIQGPGGLISRPDFAAIAAMLMPIADAMVDSELGGPTEFEFKTAMGLEYWRRTNCEWVALEVGLGGRLDATSIVTPAAGVITSIGWDHMHILGDTLAAIAREKAGIAKPGVPLVVGPVAPEARDVIHAHAQAVGAPLFQYGDQFSLEYVGTGYILRSQFGDLGPLTPGIFGAMQPENMVLAVMACLVAGAVVDPEAVPPAVRSVRAPGRFQRISFRGREIILDGAHNRDAAEVLARSLHDYGIEKVVMVTNMLQGHEAEAFYRPLLNLAVSAHVPPIDFPRARSVEEIQAVIEDGGCSAESHVGILSALDAAIADAREHPGAAILVTGSFYLIGEVGRAMAEADPALDFELQ